MSKLKNVSKIVGLVPTDYEQEASFSSWESVYNKEISKFLKKTQVDYENRDFIDLKVEAQTRIYKEYIKNQVPHHNKSIQDLVNASESEKEKIESEIKNDQQILEELLKEKEEVEKFHKEFHPLPLGKFLSKTILWLIIIGFSMLDASRLFVVFDSIIYDNPIITYILTIGISMLLNISPVIISDFIQIKKYEKVIQNTKQYHYLSLIGMTIFIIVYIGYVLLTYECRYMLCDSPSNIAISGGLNVPIIDEVDRPLFIGVIVIYIIEPLATSIINFMIAYRMSNPLKNKLDEIIKKIKKKNREIIKKTSAIHEFLNYEKMIRDLDRKNYERCIEEIDSIANKIKSNARYLISLKLASPSEIDQVSFLSRKYKEVKN